MSDKKQKIILTVGLQASGKSTWAKKMIDDNPGIYKRVNKDLLREMLDNSHWSKKNEKLIKKVRDFIVEQSLKDGYSVIVDDTNFDPSHKETMDYIAYKFGKFVGFDQCEVAMYEPTIDVEIKDFTDVPLTECIRRDSLRPNSVGKKVILDTYQRYLQKDPKPVEFIEGLPNACISDLDGTLAIKGERNIYDDEKAYLDTVNPVALNVLKNVPEDFTIIFCTGRMDRSRTVTEDWIKKNVLPHLKTKYWKLLMRKTEDVRHDEIVKEEIYHNEIEGKFNIHSILDDRPTVCRMWYKLGLPLLKVGDPDADF